MTGMWNSGIPSRRGIYLGGRRPRRDYSRMVLTVLAGVALFAGGYALGSTRPARPAHAQAGAPEYAEELFEPFWEAWRLLHADFVDQPLDDEALMQGAIRGMVDTLDDPHTAYMTPEEYDLLDTDLSGQFEGIGAEVEKDEKGDFVVVAPLDGSPAEKAGLLPGDKIVAVDGVDVRDMEQSSIVTLVRGPAGTAVTLTVRRKGVPGTFDVVVVRELIVIEDVQWRIVEGDIAYVRLAQFSTTAPANLRAALNEVMALQPRGMILDLRGNPGGLLDTAIDIMGEFIPEGPLMVERWGDGREVVYQSDGSHLAAEIPLVVLVDEGSASASEVLAVAVQARERGTIVGEQTFGKGTVQNWHQLSDGGGLRVTIARWLSPDGEWVDGNGVRPDVVVEWSGPRPKEPGEDVQLNAAIDVLRGQTLWPTWPLPWLDALPSGVAG